MGGDLPDELWNRVMEIGVQKSLLCFRDLCCISISCRRFQRLSGDGALWSALLAADFPSNSAQSSSADFKSLYRAKLERHRARKLATWRLALLREECLIADHTVRIEELRSLIVQEQEKLKTAIEELRNLDRVRRASVAIQVWQPEVVRGSQRQLVEQCTVPVESRASALEMEVKLCKQQISTYSKAFSSHKRRLTERKEALASLSYHPLESYRPDAKKMKK